MRERDLLQQNVFSVTKIFVIKCSVFRSLEYKIEFFWVKVNQIGTLVSNLGHRRISLDGLIDCLKPPYNSL